MSLVLFLDFDGVLHPLSSRMIRREAGQIMVQQDPAGEPLFCRLPLLASVLRDYPTVRLVVSSSWAGHVPWPVILEHLEPIGDRVVGALPRIAGQSRYARIAAWLMANGNPPWLALDDNPLGGGEDRRFPVDASVGLTVRDCAKLRSTLEQQEPTLEATLASFDLTRLGGKV